MRKIALGLVALMAISGCTTTEKDLTIGTGAGAVIGGIAGGGRGALIGAGAGALGGLLVRELRNGNCEYRNRHGKIYVAPCKR